ncbi:hypothetical protein JCM10207_004647 [Rhodosporidiobolus poonsookiae]
MRKATLRVYTATAIAAMSGFCFGFDNGSSGALTTMDAFFDYFGHIDEVMRGLVVSIILLPSAISGLFVGNIADRLSRKRTIALGAFIFAAGSAISAASVALGMLIAGRIIAGFGEGIFLGTLNVYLSEISPKHMRGTVMTICQFLICCGVTCGFFCCYGSTRITSPPSLAWRLPFVVNGFIALCVGLAAPFLPYSPRWLLQHNRRAEAAAVMDLLVGDGEEAETEKRELLVAGDQAQADKGAERSKRAAFLRIWQKDVRWRTIMGATINVFQMLSGIDFVLFFAPTLFTQAGLDPATASFIASGVTGILLIVSVFFTSLFIHRVGRRPIFLVGGALVSGFMLLIGVMYSSGAVSKGPGKWFTVIFIEMFAFSFGCTWAVITRLYSAEIQSPQTRAAAASFGQALNQLVNFVVALSGPVFLEKAPSGPYFFYGLLMALGTVFVFFFAIETRGKSLERIDHEFAIQTIPLAVPLPSFLTKSSSPLASARLTISDRVKEHRQRRDSRANSTSLAGEDPALRLRRPSRPGARKNSSALAAEEAGGVVGDDEVEDKDALGTIVEDPRLAFRRDMLAAGRMPPLPRMDSAIDE